MKVNTLKQLGSLLGLRTLSNAPITGFAVDSRLIAKDHVFFALPGERSDGHLFLKEAARLASCLVVSKTYTGDTFGCPCIYLDDTLQALQNLSKAVIASSNSKVVAITGSVGKTTTKDFLTTILQEKYKVSKTLGNANSQIGLPLAILNHTDGTEDILVLEMGMNAPSQLAKLLEIAPPDIAILTQVALTHAAHFDSLQKIALEKAEIFKSPKTKFGILNRDIEHFSDLYQIGSCSKITFSVASSGADFYFENFIIHTPHGVKLHLNRENPFLGKHIYENLVAAVASATHLGVSFEEIKRAEAKLVLPKKRLELIEAKQVVFVNDSYNASEISVKAALESLPKPKNGGKTVAVIGEMLELGKFSEMCHLNVGKKALEYVDHMLLLGKECAPILECWRENNKPVELFFDRSLLLDALKDLVKPYDVVLLKGSRANELWKILEEF